MDPITQGIVGSVVVQNIPRLRLAAPQLFAASTMAFLAAMAPDLDIVIRSAADPLLFLEFHRQFTHALIFIPIGGLICAWVLHYLFGKKTGLTFKQSWVICTFAFATHGLLDSCTSYGTQLFWPFSSERVAWHIMSIVDPLYTIPLLVMGWLAIKRQSQKMSVIALIWLFIYPAAGLVQHNRVMAVAQGILADTAVSRLEVKPSFANLLVWRVVYQTQKNGQAYYATAAVHAAVQPLWYAGAEVQALNVATQLPWLDSQSQQAQDIERFRWFSADYLSVDPDSKPGLVRIADMRYAMVPNEVKPLWGIELSTQASMSQHVAYYADRQVNAQTKQRFTSMLTGEKLR